MLRDVLCLVLSFLAFSKNEAATGPCLSFWPLQIHLHIAMSVFPASQNPLHICICLSFLASQKLFQFNPMFVFLASSKNPLARTYVLCSRVLALPTVYEPRCLQSSLFPLSQQISPYIYFQNGEQHSACIGLFWPLKIHYILTYVCLSGLFEKLMMHMTCFLSSVSVSKNSWEASNVLCSWVLALPTVYEPSRLQSSFLLLAYKYCRVFYFQKHFTGWHGSLYFLRLSKSIGLAECLSFCFLKIRPRMVHVLCRLISKLSHELWMFCGSFSILIYISRISLDSLLSKIWIQIIWFCLFCAFLTFERQPPCLSFWPLQKVAMSLYVLCRLVSNQMPEPKMF